MSYNQNVGGEKPSFAKGLRVILEDTPFVANTNGNPIIAADVDDYFAVNHIKNRKSVKVQGDNAPRLSVLQRARTEMPSLGIYPDYLQVFKWLWMTLQITSKTTANGVDVYEFRKPRRGIPKTGTATLEAGADDCADRAVGGAVQDFELSSGAESDPAMSVSLVAAEAVRGVPMTGGVARSAVLQFGASNVTQPGVFSVKVGDAAPQNVSLAISDTTAQTATKLLAVGLTATVAGTVATGTGERHNLNGNGPLTIYADIDVFSKTIATLQTAVRAKAGRGTAVVAGTITQAVAPGATVSGAGTAAANGSYSVTADLNGRPTYTKGVYQIASRSNSSWYITENGGIIYDQSTTPMATPPSNGWITSNGVAPAPTIAISDAATPASASLTISYDAAAGNVEDLVFVGGGYTGASTQPGANGGAITATVTAPANTPVTIAKVSGAGWDGSVSIQGSNGKVGPLPAFPFAASDWILNRNASLANIDAATLPGVVKYAFKVGNCVMPRSTANGSRTHSVVKKGTYDVTLDFTIDDDTTTARDGQVDAIIREADEQSNKVSKPSWYQLFSQSDAQHWLKIQSWMHVKSDLNASADEDVNVYDIQLEENNYSPEEFSTRIMLAVPQGTFAI